MCLYLFLSFSFAWPIRDDEWLQPLNMECQNSRRKRAFPWIERHCMNNAFVCRSLVRCRKACAVGAGFTLIELLIVVAIIAILAAIAVPNFLEAQVRAKAARVASDMRTLVTGIESYEVDWNKPPRRSDPPGVTYAMGDQAYYVPDFTKQAEEMAVFTTPVAYLTSLPVDVFARANLGRPYLIDYFDPLHSTYFVRQVQGVARNKPELQYLTTSNWMLSSVGPDGFFGIIGPKMGYPPEPSVTRSSMYVIYDPTNGTTSKGNIYRFKEQQEPFSLLHRMP